MYVCMYVYCMYVCMYVCMYISEYIYSLSELHIYSSLPFVFILFVSGLTFISERHSNSRFLFTTLLTAPTDMPNWLLQIVGWNFQLPLGLPSSLTDAAGSLQPGSRLPAAGSTRLQYSLHTPPITLAHTCPLASGAH